MKFGGPTNTRALINTARVQIPQAYKYRAADRCVPGHSAVWGRSGKCAGYIVMACIVMACIVMALCSYGLCSYGLCSYGPRAPKGVHRSLRYARISSALLQSCAAREDRAVVSKNVFFSVRHTMYAVMAYIIIARSSSPRRRHVKCI